MAIRRIAPLRFAMTAEPTTPAERTKLRRTTVRVLLVQVATLLLLGLLQWLYHTR
jgi:hypothetical protein